MLILNAMFVIGKQIKFLKLLYQLEVYILYDYYVNSVSQFKLPGYLYFTY